MAASLFLEHADFNRSRRALTSAAVSLMVLCSLDFQGSHIRILDLEIGFTQQGLIIAARLAVIYLAANFIFYAFSANVEVSPKKIGEAVDGNMERIRLIAHNEIKRCDKDRQISKISADEGEHIFSSEGIKKLESILAVPIVRAIAARALSEVLMPSILAIISLLYSFGWFFSTW